jgi:putative tryptophan/tyrosine transport system substrate-binding protein
MVALAPDVILANGTGVVAPLLQATRTLPVVFGTVVDPVAGGFVACLGRPGGNATGFTTFEYGMSGKWLELLKQIAPRTTRAAVLRDPTSFGEWTVRCHPARGTALGGAGGSGRRARCQRNRTRRSGIRNRVEWRPDHDGKRGGDRQRDLTVALAGRHRLPSVYPSVHCHGRRPSLLRA